MKKFLFKKQQIDEVLREASSNKKPLIVETDFPTAIGKAQKGDTILLKRIGGSRDDKSFKIIDARGDIVYAIETEQRVRVAIPESNLDPEEGKLKYIMLSKEGGEKKFNTPVTLDGIETVYLLRDERSLMTIDTKVDKKEDEPDSDRKKKSGEKIASDRKKDILEELNRANEGDNLELMLGELNDEEQLIEDTKTVLTFKILGIEDKRVTLKLIKAEGNKGDVYNELSEYDQLIFNTTSLTVQNKDPNRANIELVGIKGENKDSFPIRNIVVFSVVESTEGDEEESGSDTSTKKLTKKELEKLKQDPLFKQALRIDMEIDDILKRLGPKKGIKGKDRKKWKNKSKIRFEWLSHTIGQDDYRIEEGHKFSGVYNLEYNRIRVNVPKEKNERGNRALSYYFKDIRSIDKKKGDENKKSEEGEETSSDKYKVKVDVISERGGTYERLLKNEEGTIYIHDYNA